MKKLKIQFLSFLGYLLLKMFSYSIKWKFIFDKDVDKKFLNKPFILAFWHNQQLLMPWLYLKNKNTNSKQLFVMISQHGDGRIIANIIKKLGINSVAGSSTRGGKAALQKLIEVVRDGNGACLTPDGPKGPIYEAKNGIIKLAKETGAPIYPVGLSANKKWIFNSWDKMFLPKPFSTVEIEIKKAIYIPKNVNEKEFEEFRMLLDKALPKVS